MNCGAELMFLYSWISVFRVFLIDNFGGISEAYERDLSLIDHDILKLHVVIGVSSLVNLLNYLKQLAAHMQNGIQSIPLTVLL